MTETRGGYGTRFVFASAVVLLASGFLVLISVHSYCENRFVAGCLALAAIACAGVLLRDRYQVSMVIRWGSGSLLLLALTINAWFIVVATKMCNHQFDQLTK